MKIKINDNLKTLNPNDTLIDILKIFCFKEKRDKKLIKYKYKITDFFKRNFNKKYNKGLWTVIENPDGRMITYESPIEWIFDDDIEKSYKKLDIETYEKIKNLKKELYKELKENLPRILKDISNTLSLYRWKVDILFMKDIPDLFIVDIGHNHMSMTRSSYSESNHTKIILTSLDNPLIKGELLLNKKGFLSSGIIPVVGIKNGTMNFIKKSFNGYSLDKSILKDKSNKFTLLLSSEKENFDINSFSDDFKNKDINSIVTNFKNVMNNLDYLKGKNTSFIPIILISDAVKWKIIMTEKNYGSLSGTYEYYSDNCNDAEKINTYEVIKEIVSSLDIAFGTNRESVIYLKGFYDYLKDALSNQGITNEDLIEINETLKLLEY